MNGLDEIFKLLNCHQIIPDAVEVLDGIIFLRIGICHYNLVRQLQDGLVELRQRNACSDVILFCEHPPVVTVGRRECLGDGVVFLLQKNNIEVINVNRGGKATYHAPGQIVVYPVISLRQNGLGVRDFVQSMLASLAATLFDLGICARAVIDPAGVWVSDRAISGPIQFSKERKIAAVGLRIQNGITNHGFSLNFDNDLEPYNFFTPCGLAEAKMTSVAREVAMLPDKGQLLATLGSSFCRLLK